MRRKILIEISGGADSMLAALYAIDEFRGAEFHGIILEYGQIPFELEYARALNFCQKNNIELHRVQIRDLFKSGTVLGETEFQTGISDIYTPLRNLVIGSCAASLAETIDADTIVVGSKTLNLDQRSHSFPDSTLGFYVLFNSLMSYLHGGIKFYPILMKNRNVKMTKFEVFDELISRGYTLESFWNCFNSNFEMCNNCNNCNELNEYKKLNFKE